MERHWNVLKFTCGLMDNSSVLIERICEEFGNMVTTEPSLSQQNSRSFAYLYNYQYLHDLQREKSSKSLSPMNNSQICCISQRIVQPVPDCRMYYFYGREGHLRDIRRSSIPCAAIIIATSRCPCISTTLEELVLIKQPLQYLEVTFSEQARTLTSCPKCNLQKGLSVPGRTFLKTPQPIASLSRVNELNKSVHLKSSLNFHKGASVVCSWCDFQDLAVVEQSMRNSSNLGKVYLQCCHALPQYACCLAWEETVILLILCCPTALLPKKPLASSVHKLEELKNLEHLQLDNINLESSSSQLAKSISTLTSLQVASFKDCHLATETSIANLLMALTKCPLKSLSLARNKLTGSIGIVAFNDGFSLKFLERLDISDGFLSDEDILNLVRMIREEALPVIRRVGLFGSSSAIPWSRMHILLQRCEALDGMEIGIDTSNFQKQLSGKRYKCIRTSWD